MNPESFIRSREIRYKIGELLNQGKTFLEAEMEVMENDSNRSRQIKKWKKSGVYPYGLLDAPNGTEGNYTFEPTVTQQPAGGIIKQTSFGIPKNLEKNTMERYLENLSAEDVLKLTALKFGIDSSALEITTPKLRRSMDTTKPVSVRLSKELLQRVNDKLKAENKSLSGVVESLLFQWIGSPRDMVDERKNLKQKMKVLLQLINQGGAEGK